MTRRIASAAVIAGLAVALPVPHAASEPARDAMPAFARIVIDDDIPRGYQVEVADINGDGRPDIVGLGRASSAWYENPHWTKHVLTTPETAPDTISTASADFDGDGRVEIAIAYDFEMRDPARGKLAITRQTESGWTVTPVAELGSIHRVRWGDVDGDGRLDLIAAPIFGPGSMPPEVPDPPAHLVVFRAPAERGWDAPEPVAAHAVMHAIRVIDFDGEGRDEILSASNDGVSLHDYDPEARRWAVRELVAGAAGPAPARGSSEIHVGRLASGRRFLATIDPWHGNEVVVYPESARGFDRRVVLDDRLVQGHGLWVSDVDGDGADEVFAGYRGAGTSVLAYDLRDGAWQRRVLDRDIAAQDLRGGDLDGDGRPDVLAIGGATGNLIWYRTRP